MIMIIVMTILQSFAFVSMERSERAAEKVVSSVRSRQSVCAVLRSALCHFQLTFWHVTFVVYIWQVQKNYSIHSVNLLIFIHPKHRTYFFLY